MTGTESPKDRVLIVPAPTEIGMEIIESLRYLKEFELIGAGVDELNGAILLLDTYIPVPLVNDPSFGSAIKAAIATHKIDFVLPAHDDVLLHLSTIREELGAVLVAPSNQTVTVCSFKSKTYEKLADQVPVPRVYELAEVRDQNYPLFVKPDRGQGSRGARKVHSAEELKAAVSCLCDPIICEFLPGEEFTIDCFSSAEKGLQFCAARRRQRVVNGISVSSEIVEGNEFRVIAERVQKALKPTGPWFFQLRGDQKGQLTLLEVGTRIAGTMALNRARGVNFAALALYEAKGIPLKIKAQDLPTQIVRNLKNRFKWSLGFNHLYIDYDDTILLGDNINPLAIALIVQCRNEGKSVHMLSRHSGDLSEHLKQHRISQLFDTIEHLTAGERKSDFIRTSEAIFVDDSYSERQEVTNARGVLSLDVSQIPLLLKD